MKKLILIISFFLVSIVYAQAQQTDAWRDDIDYLVQRIEIMHPNPYSYISKKEFYKLKDRLYKEIPNLGDADIVMSISELLTALHDGHTRWAFEYSDPQWLEQTFHVLPIIQYPFKDGIYILAGLPRYSELVGLRVNKIGNMPIDEVTSRLGKIWSHDNLYGERKFLYYTLSIAEMLKKAGAIEDVSNIEVILQNESNEEVKAQITTVSFMSMARFFANTWYPQASKELVTMNGSSEKSLPLWLKNVGKSFWYEYIPEEKTMFLQINSLNFPHSTANEEGSFGQLCEQFFEALDKSEAEKLVIDIRVNTGGNHVELPLLKGIIARPHIDKQNKLFLITSRVTYSAAVHLTTILKKYTNITIIGEPASGRPNHYGAVRSFKLPNHPQIEIHCSVDYYQDSEPFDFNIINAPDIWIEMTAVDYQRNIDPMMEAVRDYDQIVEKVNKLTMELEKEYNDNGLTGMKDVYLSKKQSLLESGYNLEKFFMEFYYRFLLKNKKSGSDVSDYLAFAISECPESIDLCYSLAALLESEERFDEANRMYYRCLELNPAHHYAKMKLGLMGLED